MASHPEDLNLFMGSYLATKPWDADPDILPIPWRSTEEVMPEGQLCFAYAFGDELVSFYSKESAHISGHSASGHIPWPAACD